MRHVESWLAAGMAIMAVLVVGGVLYLDTVLNERDDLTSTVALLLGVIEQQNRIIVAEGGIPVTVPSTPTSAAPTTTTTGTTTTTAPPTTTTTQPRRPPPSTTTTTQPDRETCIGPVCIGAP